MAIFLESRDGFIFLKDGVRHKNDLATLTSGAGKFLEIPGEKLGKSWELFSGICWDSWDFMQMSPTRWQFRYIPKAGLSNLSKHKT